MAKPSAIRVAKSFNAGMPLFSWDPFACLLLAIAWVGHACLWVYPLNVLYSQALPKRFLRPWRYFTGLMIVAGYPLFLVLLNYNDVPSQPQHYQPMPWNAGLEYYFLMVLVLGLVLPLFTMGRLLRRDPAAVVRRAARVLDWSADRKFLSGVGKWAPVARLGFNDIFRVEFTELMLRLPHAPRAWDGLTLLHLTDFHFHGTPAQDFFQRILDEIQAQPVPDVIVLTGDYLDSDAHRGWIEQLLGQLKWTEAAFALLGNHDANHDPDRTREQLQALGITVLSNRWVETVIRGERVVVAGNEEPWFCPAPVLPPRDCFRLGLSHSPDPLRGWAVSAGIDLLFCGHVHGGQIRLPLIGSIFVPSQYGRTYDEGVFEHRGTTMVVSRGLSGKEPLRFRCPPQVIRVTLSCP
jgi:uncharacterized protein